MPGMVGVHPVYMPGIHRPGKHIPGLYTYIYTQRGIYPGLYLRSVMRRREASQALIASQDPHILDIPALIPAYSHRFDSFGKKERNRRPRVGPRGPSDPFHCWSGLLSSCNFSLFFDRFEQKRLPPWGYTRGVEEW